MNIIDRQIREAPPEYAGGSDNGQAIARVRAARASLEIDLDAIGHNLQLIKSACGAARVMAVVKGDAYGCGAHVIAPFIEACGIGAFAVDNVAEGITLRDAGVQSPILIIDGDLEENVETAVEYRLVPGIAHHDLLRAYDGAARRRGVQYPVWLVANVGFNRSGYRAPDLFRRFLERARSAEYLRVLGVYAHLSNSNLDHQTSLAQIDEYRQAAAMARQVLGAQIETSVFASHGLLRWAPTIATDWVRPGILLYGEHGFDTDMLEPDALSRLRAFRPALRLRGRVAHVLSFDAEEGVGYGQHVRTHRGQRLATVALGFGSGYPYGDRGLEAILHGQRVPLFGAVGMDALQIDVTHVESVSEGDWVTFLGSDQGDAISVHALSRAAQMSPYELMSRFALQRSYVRTKGRWS